MYPVWEVPSLSAGVLLGLIAAFHMLPSHLSTSAMWFNIYVETKAYRENRPELLEFIRKYTLMILVFAYVLGSLSGVGIWYAATVANPRGISGLIHNYVWGWATEWVFFIIEVVGIFTYYYTFGKVDRKTHLKIGWIFAIGSWTTMIIIVGILAFMASPGKWPATGNFFDGFFNQTYWPQLLMRTSLMFAIAATYAIAVATKLSDDAAKSFIIRTASKWGIGGLVLGSVFTLLYIKTLPAAAGNVLGMASFLLPGLKTGMLVSLGLLILYFVYANFKPLTLRLIPAILAIAVLFGGIWSIERTREMIRKPYVIQQYMYSNQLIGHDFPAKQVVAETKAISEKGILKVSPYVPDGLREVTEGNKLEAGKLTALILCSSCHTLDESGIRPMPQMIRRMEFKPHAEAATEIGEIAGFIDTLGDYQYMPPFAGSAAEKEALAAYLYTISRIK
ncbi:MAG: cytochrome C [Deltaproteobacteria bacterium]|nr:cytochrome C [Deltaproteobacteria bacterium]